MAELDGRSEMVRNVIGAARRDGRIVGLVDFGSRGGRWLDDWSDIDIGVFVRDDDFDVFVSEAAAWVARFGDLLLVLDIVPGGPPLIRAAYDGRPLPLRVDAVFRREGEIDTAFGWPEVPTVVESVVSYDGTGGKLTTRMRACATQSLGPREPTDEFAQISGEFWYYLLDTLSKFGRGDEWGTRMLFHVAVVPGLVRLLRLEAGATERWRGTPTVQGIEEELPAHRMAQLDRCALSADRASTGSALDAAARLGQEVCVVLGARWGRQWPHQLAERLTGAT